MAILTNNSKVDNALRLYKEAQTMFFAFGNSNTEWKDPATPPEPSASITSLDELVGIKKVSSVSLACTVDSPTGQNVVSFGGQNYELVGLSDAYARNAHFVYITTVLKQNDFSVTTHRSVALTKQPVYDTSLTGDAIPAESVISQGSLQVVQNTTLRDSINSDTLEYLIISA